MDYSILFVIGIGLVVVISGYLGFRFLKNKGISVDEISKGVNVTETALSFTKEVIKQMKLPEEQVNKVYNIVVDTLEYIKTMTEETTNEEKINNAVEYTKELCKVANISIDDTRENILKTAITMAYNAINSLDKKTE